MLRDVVCALRSPSPREAARVGVSGERVARASQRAGRGAAAHPPPDTPRSPPFKGSSTTISRSARAPAPLELAPRDSTSLARIFSARYVKARPLVCPDNHDLHTPTHPRRPRSPQPPRRYGVIRELDDTLTFNSLMNRRSLCNKGLKPEVLRRDEFVDGSL